MTFQKMLRKIPRITPLDPLPNSIRQQVPGPSIPRPGSHWEHPVSYRPVPSQPGSGILWRRHPQNLRPLQWHPRPCFPGEVHRLRDFGPFRIHEQTHRPTAFYHPALSLAAPDPQQAFPAKYVPVHLTFPAERVPVPLNQGLPPLFRRCPDDHYSYSICLQPTCI